jgi:redox-sensitive bicupin YhaK (pirin superfamily)
MITVRKADDRGRFDHGWLDTAHTFSFGEYHDPEHMAFRSLRVINEDVVAPGRGFGAHPHRDMEIITYVLSGALAHKDSTGGEGELRPGEVQRMTAGSGIVHSEFNASRTEPVHLLQIWIFPDRRGHEPGYEQKAFPFDARRGRLALLASPDGAEGSLRINQDASLSSALLDPGGAARHPLADGRHAWVQVARGSGTVNGVEVKAGDGVAVSGEPAVELRAAENGTDFLVFDLA